MPGIAELLAIHDVSVNMRKQASALLTASTLRLQRRPAGSSVSS
jgi:hypothetical protein